MWKEWWNRRKEFSLGLFEGGVRCSIHHLRYSLCRSSLSGLEFGEIFSSVMLYGWRRRQELFHHENFFDARILWTVTALDMRGGGAVWITEISQVVGYSANALDIGWECSQLCSYSKCWGGGMEGIMGINEVFPYLFCGQLCGIECKGTFRA